jgi:serine/threonine protein kinase
MKQVCIQCGQNSLDGNQWCPRRVCALDYFVPVLRDGDPFRDFTIRRLLRVTQTAVFYEALRGKQRVMLKVAHRDGQGTNKRGIYAEALRREADVFAAVNAANLPTLPTLLPPYGDDLKRQSTTYGKVDVNGVLYYYLVFEPVEGVFLRDWLNRMPQPPEQDVIRIGLQIARTVGYLLDTMKLWHLAITPEAFMIRRDMDGVPRVTLVNLGFTQPVSESKRIVLGEGVLMEQPSVMRRLLPVAYTAPELLGDPVANTPVSFTPTTDGYGIGLLLYEMLAGHPVQEYQVRTEAMVEQAVREANKTRLLRADVRDDVQKLVNRALQLKPADRRSDEARLLAPMVIYTTLYKIHGGDVPVERKRRGIMRAFEPQYRQFWFLSALVIVGTLIVLAVTALTTPI